MESLTVPGSLDSLGKIAQYVSAAAKVAGLDKKAAYRLRLAVDEIATNIIVYGYEQAGLEGSLSVRVDINEQDLTILIEDTGVAYDPTQKALPDDLDLPLAQRQIGGLGVYLAIEGVDKFSYERVGNRNHNIFLVNRNPK